MSEPAASRPIVRFLYLVPTDQQPKEQYVVAIANAATNLQSWFKTKLNNQTFNFPNGIETTTLPHDTAWYGAQPSFWDAINEDAFQLTGGKYDDPNAIWVNYVDIDTPCGQVTGDTSHVALLPQDDLRGLVDEKQARACPNEGAAPTFDANVNRWIGGLGHELGHAIGLMHPAGCVDSNSTTSCDSKDLM